MKAQPEQQTLEARLETLDWMSITGSLSAQGFARTPVILSPSECEELIGFYDNNQRFRSRIDMARYRFGQGEYKYFSNPLPELVSTLRTRTYPRLVPVANQWQERLRRPGRFPEQLDAMLSVCAKAGQNRPTPLLLKYETGGYNCLHQDIYGEVVFPIQLTIVLSRAGEDFFGGEFVLVEQRPRAQSKPCVVHLQQGQAVIFTTREYPVEGSKGFYRAMMRHGVSRIESGSRFSLGVIFHNAK